MITIVCMRMIMHPAEPVIDKMGPYNKNDGRHQQPCFIVDKELFQDKKNKSRTKKQEGLIAMMVFFEAMIKRVTPDAKGQGDHTTLKCCIMNNIDTK